MKNTKFKPNVIKEQYYRNYGLLNSSRKLADIINEIEGAKKYRFVFYRDFKEVLQKHSHLWQLENVH